MTTQASVAIGSSSPAIDVAQRARQRTARRLLPFLFILYVIAFPDRMNIGAAALQMPRELGFTAASIGLINAVGNLGGFVGPLVMGYLVDRTHSFSAGLLYLVANLFASGILMLAVGRRLHDGGEAGSFREV